MNSTESPARRHAVPKLTPERAAAQRRRILDAALICFAKQGFQAASMQDIVRESSLSPGAIYGYFKSKTEIVLAIALERHMVEAAHIQQALEQQTLDGTLEALLDRFVRSLYQPQERAWRDIAIQLWAESLRDERIRGIAVEGVDGPAHLLTQLIENLDGNSASAEGSNQARARVLIACVQGLALQTAWDPNIDLDACARVLRAMVQAGEPQPSGNVWLEAQIKRRVRSTKSGVRPGVKS
ncbi:MAG: TetR/AcrR family transcriptional regulator [Methylocella sp.]